MRFLFIQPVLSYRGAERVIASLTSSLIEQQHQVKIIFLKKDLSLSENFFNPKIELITPPYAINILFQNNIIFTIFASFTCIYELRHARNSDVLVTDSFPCLWPSILIGQLLKKKVTWMIHSLEEFPPPNATKIHKLYFSTILSINRLLITKNTIAVTNSPKVTNTAHELFPKLMVTEIIPSVSQTSSQASNDLRYGLGIGTNKVIICIGQLHPFKNQQLAIDAIAHVTEKIPNITLILIGAGNHKQFDSHRLKNSNIIFTGQLTYAQIQEYYRITDIVLQTAYYPEGLGLTPFEGLLFKKIPIVVEGSGAAMILKDREIGIVVKNDAKELTDAIVAYISHPERYEYTIQNGWKYVTTQLTVKIYFEKFLQLINSL
ncbi:MAG: glycosyltransferase family 4 protein [bacterium]|nr:glycosyltransferase family 4 protein [bacterium]